LIDFIGEIEYYSRTQYNASVLIQTFVHNFLV